MTSKLCFSDIKHCTVKSSSDVAVSRAKEGRLPAGTVVNRIQPGQKIDVLILKKLPEYITPIDKINTKAYFDWIKTVDVPKCIEFDEELIRKRQTYKYSDISDNSFENQRLAVGTDFFKGVEVTDTIYLILH